MTIGQRVRARREELGLSQDELAKRMGYSGRSSICNIESDRNTMKQSKIKQLADALDTTPAYLMGWTNEDPEEDGTADVVLLNKFHSLQPVHQRAVIAMIDALLNEPE